MLRKTCAEISIAQFKLAYCSDDYSGLIISGKPSQQELLAAWNDLIFDYTYSIKTENSDYLLDLLRTMGLLQADIIYTENAVVLLRHRYDQDIVNELISMGYDGVYNWDDKENYNRQLDRVLSLCKSKILTYSETKDEYERMNKTLGGKKLTIEDFDKNVAMVSRYMRYRIDQDKTMMTEYISYLNAYVAEMNWINKRQINNEEA